MQEFEPKKKVKIFTKEFLARYAYIFVIAIILIGGISYGYTFFVQKMMYQQMVKYMKLLSWEEVQQEKLLILK